MKILKQLFYKKTLLSNFLWIATTTLLFTGCTKNPISQTPDAPVIFSISPVMGKAGTTVIIKGSNFATNTYNVLVKFNNTPANVIAASKDSLTVTSPINGTTGPVSVTINGITATGPVFIYQQDSIIDPAKVDTLDVYMTTSNNGVIYYKNGTEFFLEKLQGVYDGANGLAVSDSDVYVVGTSNSKAAFWKNGIKTELPTYDPNSLSFGTCIFISGKDIYIGGSDGYSHVYWKNGIEHKLPQNGNGYVNAIAVKGNDVYTGGDELSLTFDLVYWKNDIETTLGKNTKIDYGVTGIALDGSDVYVCGTDSGNALYWKNDMKVNLSKYSCPSKASANAITIKGNDIYVAGNCEEDAVYWKNGQQVSLPYFSYTASATCIALFQSDVYVGGWDGPSAVYWKNGIEYHLCCGNSEWVTSIVVVKP